MKHIEPPIWEAPDDTGVRDQIAVMIDWAKTCSNIKTDYQLAKEIGVTQSALINYRRGKTMPDERVISALCQLTGDDPFTVAAYIQAERSKTKEARDLWYNAARRLGKTEWFGSGRTPPKMAAIIAIASAIVSIAGYAPNAEATALNTSKTTGSSMYIMFSYLRALFRALRRAGRATLVYFAQGINHVQSADTDAPYPHAA